MRTEPPAVYRRHRVTSARASYISVVGMDVADAGLKWTGWSSTREWELRHNRSRPKGPALCHDVMPTVEGRRRLIERCQSRPIAPRCFCGGAQSGKVDNQVESELKGAQYQVQAPPRCREVAGFHDIDR